jgi:hypothetical protein
MDGEIPHPHPAEPVSLMWLGRRAWKRRRRRVPALLAWARSRSAPRRATLECGLALAIIALLTTGLAWTVWSATVDRQAGIEPSGSTSPSTVEGDLTDDLTTSNTADLARAPSRRGRAEADPDAVGGSTGPRGLTLSGPLIGGSGAGAVALAGVLAGRLVLRRYRAGQGGDLSSSPTSLLQHTGPDLGHDLEAEPEPEDAAAKAQAGSHDPAFEPDATPGMGPLSTSALGCSSTDDTTPEQPAVTCDPDLSAMTTEQTTAVATGRPGESVHLSLPDSDSEPNQRLGHSANLHAPTAHRALQNATPVQASSSPHLESSPDVGQRLYERRTTPRVEYVADATIHLPTAALPITVLDISEAGLRCQFPQSTGTTPPANGDYVRVTFPADTATVNVKAQVAWRRGASDHLQLGVSFVGLAPGDRDQVRRVVSARLPQ